MTLLDLESLVLELPDLPLAAPVERPGLASWRAASMQVLDGLLLRFSEGYTRQNNCANACMAGPWLWPRVAWVSYQLHQETRMLRTRRLAASLRQG